MFGVSFEHLLIVGVILLLVGPKRLPELGNTMGKAIKNFKDSFAGVEEASFKRIGEKTAANAPGSAPSAAAPAVPSEPAGQDAATQTQSETHPKVPPVGPA